MPDETPTLRAISSADSRPHRTIRLHLRFGDTAKVDVYHIVCEAYLCEQCASISTFEELFHMPAGEQVPAPYRRGGHLAIRRLAGKRCRPSEVD